MSIGSDRHMEIALRISQDEQPGLRIAAASSANEELWKTLDAAPSPISSDCAARCLCFDDPPHSPYFFPRIISRRSSSDS